MTQITISRARPEDISEIAAIYEHAVRHGTASYELEPPSQQEMAARFDAIASAGFPWLAARCEGRLAGYAYASAFRPRPAYRFMAEDSVYLAPDMQGRGIGRRLLSALIGEVEALGFRQIIAVIGDGHDASPSVLLHQRLGFRQTGRIEGSGYKHGRWLDTVLMQRALNGGDTIPPDPASLPERRFRGEA